MTESWKRVKCPQCGNDGNLYAHHPTTISYHLSSDGTVTAPENPDLDGELIELGNVHCNNCGNEGPADAFLIRSLTLLPSPESESDKKEILTAIRADHIETCPECHTDIDIICISTNDSDEFQPMIMWCPCGNIWHNSPK